MSDEMVALANRMITYSPPTHFIGNDWLGYMLTDARGANSTGRFFSPTPRYKFKQEDCLREAISQFWLKATWTTRLGCQSQPIQRASTAMPLSSTQYGKAIFSAEVSMTAKTSVTIAILDGKTSMDNLTATKFLI